jgi:hypothetical protein
MLDVELEAMKLERDLSRDISEENVKNDWLHHSYSRPSRAFPPTLWRYPRCRLRQS